MQYVFSNSGAIKHFNVLVQIVRNKSLINTRRPRKPHFWAQMVQTAMRPILPKPYDKDFPQFYKCRKLLKKELLELPMMEENPYEQILANEIKEKLTESKMILILHRNALNGEEFYGSITEFKKQGITLLRNSRTTVKMAVENTKYRNILRLFEYHTLLLCSPDIKLYVTFQLLKKMPYYILLGGIVDGNFLKRNKLDEYSKITNINEIRAQLAATISATPSQLVQNLSQHQMTTVSCLNQYIESKSSKNKTETSEQVKKLEEDK